MCVSVCCVYVREMTKVTNMLFGVQGCGNCKIIFTVAWDPRELGASHGSEL